MSSTKALILLSLANLYNCQMEPFVVEGQPAKITDYPHSALMTVFCDLQNVEIPWICGASVLSNIVLLTAAHCLLDCNQDHVIAVSLGHRNLFRGALIGVSSFIMHEDFDPFETNNDVALVKLEVKLKLGSYIKRIALMSDPPYFEPAKMAGWGLIDEINNLSSDTLQVLDQYVWTTPKCEKILKSIPNGTFCADNKSKDSYPSGGDSGSALVVRGYIQIGIVSYKMPKVSRSLVVYTDTGYFYEWIKKNTRRLYCV